MSSVDTINRTITDGTFIDWMRETQQYTIEREELFHTWQQRCKEYRELEFAILLSRTATTSEIDKSTTQS